MTGHDFLAADDLGPTICIGEILVEIMSTTVGEGFLEPQELTGPYPSGAPAIFIDQCARIGGSAAMIGTVGNDDFGRLNINRLANDGADVSAIAVDADYPTGSAFVRYRPEGSRDFVYNIATSAASRLSRTDAVDNLISRAGHLHVMGTALSMASAREMIVHAAPVILGRGGTLSLDPNLRKELGTSREVLECFENLIGMAHLLLPSGEELERAAGTAGPDAAIRTLFERGVSEIVLKKGAEGSTYFDKHGVQMDCAAFQVREVDPTGAGDCFGGAYVACRRLGLPAAEALLYANAAGARNVSVQGPMEGAGTRAELDLFIREQGRAAT
jgi:tagatose kinase